MKDDRLQHPAKATSILMLAGVLAFYLSILFIAGAAVQRLAASVDARLTDQVTLVVWGRGLESADAAAARAAELLNAQAGVRRAEVLDVEENDGAISELIARRPLGSEQTRLVSIVGDPATLPPLSSLRQLLEAGQLTASLDDHRGTRGLVETRTLVLSRLAIAFGVFLCGGLFGLCVHGGQGKAGAGTARYDLMSGLGAEPALIAADVARRLGSMALLGALAGTVCADALVFTATSLRLVPEITTLFHPRLADVLWTILWPILTTLIAATAAGLGAWRALVHRERTL